ncbi:MAG: peptide ABC transporter permease, partial [Anaerolinea sp.]|nr:peptide ABC transporter permease [Anaerolinea sp.]
FVLIVFAQAIMNTAALSFLGLSGDLSAPEWGNMLAEARQVIRAAPALGVPPGAAIAITVLLANQAAASLNR